MLSSSWQQAADDQWESDENSFPSADAEEDELGKEHDLAQINVAKYLGYSKQRLKEMWEWRMGDGPLWKASMDKNSLPKRDKGLPRDEITSFCEKLQASNPSAST